MIERYFTGFEGIGIDGVRGKFDGKALIVATGPQYRGQRWTLARAKAKRKDGIELHEECEPDLEKWIRAHENWAKEIDKQLETISCKGK